MSRDGVALLFPGQGAQSVGMARAAYESSAAARAVFARADATLGYALSRLCFEGPEEHLRRTDHQQPAILVASLAHLAAREEHDGPFAVAAATGHSLGFYTALVAAGALALEEAVRLVALRGELMQRASQERPGGMAAVLGLDDATVEEACAEVSHGDGVVVAANYNAPGQVVISGAREALDRAVERLKEQGARKVVSLPVAGAFHSPLMRPAAEALAPALHAATLRAAAYPLIANADPRPLREANEIRAELLGQILAPVRWAVAIRHLASSGIATFVDCGPAATLAGLMKRILAVGDQPSAISAVRVIKLDE